MSDKKLNLSHKLAGIIDRLIKTTSVRDINLATYKGGRSIQFEIEPNIKETSPHIISNRREINCTILPELIEIIGELKDNTVSNISLSDLNTEIKSEDLNLIHSGNVLSVSTKIDYKTEDFFSKFNVSSTLKYKTKVNRIKLDLYKPKIFKIKQFQFSRVIENYYLIKKCIMTKSSVQLYFLSEKEQLSYWRKAIIQTRRDPKNLEMIGVYHAVPYYNIENFKIDFKLKELKYKLKENSIAKKIKVCNIIIFRDIEKNKGIIIEDQDKIMENTVIDTKKTIKDRQSENDNEEIKINLTIIDGLESSFGKTFSFFKNRITLGRGDSNDLPINDIKISKFHCELKIKPDKNNPYIEIEDLNSTNGTYLNGNLIGKTFLTSGDKIEIGDVTIRFTINDDVEDKYHSKLFSFATIDAMTGLYNKRYIKNELESQIKIAKRNKRKLSLMIIDIDDFKKLNDTYGHIAGDEFLKKTAFHLSRSLREQDSAGRFGGEEYVVFIDILPESIKYLKKNIEKIGIPSDHYRIISGDYNRSIISLGKDEFKFDIIFLDPPYKLLEYANPLKVIHKRDILEENGIIVVERPIRTDFDGKFFEKYKTNRLGKKCLDFYRNFKKKTGEKNDNDQQ